MLDDVSSVTLQMALAGLSQRQKVTANNIANLETPNFQASKVDFESNLSDALAAGSPATSSPTVSGTGDSSGANGNNVSLENEIATASKTTLQEQLMSSSLTSMFGYMSTVLKG